MANYKAPLAEAHRAPLKKMIEEVGLLKASKRLDVSRETLATAALGQNVTSAIRFKLEHLLRELGLVAA